MKSWLDALAERKRRAVTWAWALLRRPGRHLYWTFVGEAHRICGTRLWERRWFRRGVGEVRKGFSNLNHPHREWLMKQFDALYPFTSVLEIGCGYGPNLELLAMRFPEVEILGIDINPISVREGNIRLAKLGIKNTQLMVGRADALSGFTDSSIDIVFSDATLLYIGPDKIMRVIAEMSRISRRALLFIELHHVDSRRDSGGLGVYTPDGWVRDYRKLLKQFFDEDSITLTKVPADVWPTGQWPAWGYLITVMRSRGGADR